MNEFPLPDCFINNVIRLIEQASRMRLHTMCFDLIRFFERCKTIGMTDAVLNEELKRHMEKVKLFLEAVL